MTIKLAIILPFLTLFYAASAQLSTDLHPKSLTGNLYTDADDSVNVYLNGNPILSSGVGTKKSEQLTLTENDRIVVVLKNKTGGRRFYMAFLGKDKKSLINFLANDFRIIPTDDTTDFTEADFKTWTKRPRRDKLKNPFPFKNFSQSFWGDLDTCSLACILSSQMVPKSTP